MITVGLLLDLFIDDAQEIYVYNLDTEEEIFRGEACDLDEDIREMTVMSLDNIYKDSGNFFGINVESEDESWN